MIEAFVRARLAEVGSRPRRRRLTRRLFLDLTGLPPGADEVAAFVTDPWPEAYRKLVERLHAGPHFGERMALPWLDAARYADTNGFSIDGGRQAWLWRDFVIHAFNRGKPYDRFLVGQRARDLLPDRNDETLTATGFQRNSMIMHEGGTIPEENLVTYGVDRVRTFGVLPATDVPLPGTRRQADGRREGTGSPCVGAAPFARVDSKTITCPAPRSLRAAAPSD